MVSIKIKGKICWICGKTKEITRHHLKNRKLIYLCRDCHDEVEEAKVYVNIMKSRKAAFRKGKIAQLESLIVMLANILEELEE